MLWKDERSRIRVIHMDKLRGLLGIRRMDKVLNAPIRELCKMMNGVDEKIDEILLWFSHEKRMKYDRIVKRVYVKESAGSRSMGKSQKRWIDTLKNYLRKRGLGIRQGRRMVKNKSEWHGFMKGDALGIV